MRLIKTNDGMYGWNLNGKMIWCDDMSQLNTIGWAHVAPRKDPGEYESFCKNISYALDHMAKVNHAVAEFGIFGSFMYTTEDAA